MFVFHKQICSLQFAELSSSSEHSICPISQSINCKGRGTGAVFGRQFVCEIWVGNFNNLSKWSITVTVNISTTAETAAISSAASLARTLTHSHTHTVRHFCLTNCLVKSFLLRSRNKIKSDCKNVEKLPHLNARVSVWVPLCVWVCDKEICWPLVFKALSHLYSFGPQTWPSFPTSSQMRRAVKWRCRVSQWSLMKRTLNQANDWQLKRALSG